MATLNASTATVDLDYMKELFLPAGATQNTPSTPIHDAAHFSEVLQQDYTSDYYGADFTYPGADTDGLYYPDGGIYTGTTVSLNGNVVFTLSGFSLNVVDIASDATDEQIHSMIFSGNDSITLGSGSDTIAGFEGNDTIDGGAGTDAVVYAGVASDFTVKKTGSGYSVKDNINAAGTDTLSNIEKIQFSDLTVDLAIQGKAASVSVGQLDSLVELYVAFFNRTPDAGGLGYWIDSLKSGRTLDQIANDFYGAGVQYSNLTGYSSEMSNAEFVGVVYANVLGRTGNNAPTDGEIGYWDDRLASGAASRGDLLSTMLGAAHGYKGDATWGWVPDLLDNKIAVGKQVAVNMGITYNTGEDSISQGMSIAAAITPTGTADALKLIGFSGIGDAGMV